MFASNFPVSSLKISFDDLYNNYNKIVKNFSLNEKKDLFYNTALNVYKLNIKLRSKNSSTQCHIFIKTFEAVRVPYSLASLTIF